VISEAEMAQLLTLQEKKLLKNADSGFRLREPFLLVLILFFTIRLLFFPEQIQLHLNIDSDVHLLNYLRDWYFERGWC